MNWAKIIIISYFLGFVLQGIVSFIPQGYETYGGIDTNIGLRVINNINVGVAAIVKIPSHFRLGFPAYYIQNPQYSPTELGCHEVAYVSLAKFILNFIIWQGLAFLFVYLYHKRRSELTKVIPVEKELAKNKKNYLGVIGASTLIIIITVVYWIVLLFMDGTMCSD